MSTINFDKCPICFEAFADNQNGEVIIRVHGETSVPHDFHEKCLEAWVKTRREASDSCPTCRRLLSERDMTFFKRDVTGRYEAISHAPLNIPGPIRLQASVSIRLFDAVFLIFFVGLCLLAREHLQFGVYPEYQPRTP